jgi:hypothetical protein
VLEVQVVNGRVDERLKSGIFLIPDGKEVGYRAMPKFIEPVPYGRLHVAIRVVEQVSQRADLTGGG